MGFHGASEWDDLYFHIFCFHVCLQCRSSRMDNVCGRDPLYWAAEDIAAKKMVQLI